jgi:RHS repeat-associated protein
MQVSERAKHASEDATYRFDAIGNMTTKTSTSRDTTSDLNYSFDYEYYAGTHRVARIGDWRYEYDLNGNLVAETYGQAVTGTGTAGRNVREDGGVYSADYGFGYIDVTGTAGNGAGGGTAGERREYRWNDRGLLRSSANRRFSAEYRYGADGERAVKFSVSGTARSETLYFNRLLTVSRIQGYETESKHIYVGEARIATKRKDAGNAFIGQETRQVYYYHPDHLGSTQLVTDWDGRIYEHLEYTPYGELWVDHAVAAVATNPTVYRFSGKEMDEETGFYYYGARYLDPRTSRWISADPAMGEYVPVAPVNDEAKKRNGNLPGMGGVFNHVNLHVYHYAGNNPVKYVDPTGETATYSIDDESKTVTINVDIIIYGDDATDNIAQEYKKGIENAWGGPWSVDINGEQYSVNFNVNVSVGKKPDIFKKLWNFFFGTNNYIEASSSIPQSEVVLGFMGTWRTKGRYGMTLADDNPAAHEFGHLLGFRDRYTDLGGVDPNWTGNIMAEWGGIVEQRNIDTIGDRITGPSKQKKGILRSWRMPY